MSNAFQLVQERAAEEAAPVALPSLIDRARSFVSRRSSIVQALLSIFDQAIVSGTSFATAVIVARASSAEQLGQYYLMLSILLVGLDIQENLVSWPHTVLGARRRGSELAEFTGSAWALFVVLMAAIVLVLAGALGAASFIGAADIRSYWLLLGVGPLILLRDVIRRFAFARLDMRMAIGLDAAVAILQMAGLFLLWQFGRMTLGSIFGVMGGACGLACIGAFTLRPPAPTFVRTRILADWKEKWTLAKWALLSYSIVDTIRFVMPWAVFVAGGLADSGVYGACVTLIGVTNVLIAGTGNFLKPKAAESFVHHRVAGLTRVLRYTALAFVALFGLLCLTIGVTGDLAAVLIFGDDYGGTGSILLVLALSQLASSLGTTSGNGLWAIGQLRASFLADIAMVLTTFVAAVCLVGPLGPLGAAWSTFIGMVVGSVLKIVILRVLLRSIDADDLGATSSTETSAEVCA